MLRYALLALLGLVITASAETLFTPETHFLGIPNADSLCTSWFINATDSTDYGFDKPTDIEVLRLSAQDYRLVILNVCNDIFIQFRIDQEAGVSRNDISHSGSNPTACSTATAMCQVRYGTYFNPVTDRVAVVFTAGAKIGLYRFDPMTGMFTLDRSFTNPEIVRPVGIFSAFNQFFIVDDSTRYIYRTDSVGNTLAKYGHPDDMDDGYNWPSDISGYVDGFDTAHMYVGDVLFERVDHLTATASTNSITRLTRAVAHRTDTLGLNISHVAYIPGGKVIGLNRFQQRFWLWTNADSLTSGSRTDQYWDDQESSIAIYTGQACGRLIICYLSYSEGWVLRSYQAGTTASFDNPQPHHVNWSNQVNISQNTTIDSGMVLNLAPGTSVNFSNGAVLDIRGQIKALGTAAQPITFHGPDGSRTGTVKLTNSRGDSAWNHLKYCNMHNLIMPLSAKNSSLLLDSVSITNISNLRSINDSASTITLVGCDTLGHVFLKYDTLNIAKGTTLHFSSLSKLASTHGVINAIGGTGSDSIKFRGINAGTWAGITDTSGVLNMDYCSIMNAATNAVFTYEPSTNLPFGATSPVSINHTLIDGSNMPQWGIALRLWNSPSIVQTVKNSLIQNCGNGTNGTYLFNCKVNFDSVTIRNCAYVNSYIKQVTGNFRNCTFSGRTSYYSVLMNEATCTPNFQCCTFENLAPSSGDFMTSIFCASGTVPSLGYTYASGTNGSSNVCSDSSAFLLTFEGYETRPIIQFIGSPSEGGPGGHNDWIQNSPSGKYFEWRDAYKDGDFWCAEQAWNKTPVDGMFSPKSDTINWKVTPYDTTAFGLCYGGSSNKNMTSIHKSDFVATGKAVARGQQGLDDQRPDSAIFGRAIMLEDSGYYADAQSLFRSVVASSPDSALRWMAMTHVVTTSAQLPLDNGWIPTLIDSLIGAQDSSYYAYLLGHRMVTSYLMYRGEYANAVENCNRLFERHLEFRDSIYVAIDLIGVQYAAGLREYTGEGLDGMGNNIPAALRIQSDIQGLELEHNLLGLIGSSRSKSRDRIAVPASYKLYQNHPNPFNPITDIRFDLPEKVRVELIIFNTLGQKVATLVDDVRPAGAYQIQWDSKNASGVPVSTGMYIYQLKAGNFTSTKKMLLLR
jgi:hypothetical protein